MVPVPPEAAKHYTRCIAINPRNVLALSNRAMAFLKTRQHLKAERDCSAALRVDPAHVKSLTRRATARNDTGRHHHALFRAVGTGDGDLPGASLGAQGRCP